MAHGSAGWRSTFLSAVAIEVLGEIARTGSARTLPCGQGRIELPALYLCRAAQFCSSTPASMVESVAVDPFLGFALERSWELIQWIRTRRVTDQDWAKKLVERARESHPALLDDEQAGRLAESLLRAALVTVGVDETDPSAAINSIVRSVSPTGLNRQTQSIQGDNAAEIYDALWEALLATADPREVVTLQLQVEAARGISYTLTFLQEVYDRLVVMGTPSTMADTIGSAIDASL